MKKVTANQPFYGSKDEQQWAPGETRELTAERAQELIKLGLVDEAKEPKTKEAKELAGRSTKEDKTDLKTKDDK